MIGPRLSGRIVGVVSITAVGSRGSHFYSSSNSENSHFARAEVVKIVNQGCTSSDFINLPRTLIRFVNSARSEYGAQ